MTPVDPVFDAVITELFGDAVDTAELYAISKSNPDPSSVHVNTAGAKKLKQKKRDAQIGLANNAIGATAGTIATAQAYKVARNMNPENMKKTRTGRFLLKTKINPKVAVPAAGAAGVGLQAFNGAADAWSAKYFGQELKDMSKPKKQKVKKDHDVTWSGEISKVDTEKRQVFGWASVTHVDGEPVIDRQGDYIPLDELEDAAYTYVIDSRKGGDMHRRVGKAASGADAPVHVSDMIESFVVTPEKLKAMGLPADAVNPGWWVGYKVNDDEQWQLVKDGKRLGFSVHGAGRRVKRDTDADI